MYNTEILLVQLERATRVLEKEVESEVFMRFAKRVCSIGRALGYAVTRMPDAGQCELNKVADQLKNVAALIAHRLPKIEKLSEGDKELAKEIARLARLRATKILQRECTAELV